jgi:hypothetical protein
MKRLWPNHAFERDGVTFGGLAASGATSLVRFAHFGAAQRERWGAEKSSGQFYLAGVADVTARLFGLAGQNKSA